MWQQHVPVFLTERRFKIRLKLLGVSGLSPGFYRIGVMALSLGD